MATTYQYFNTTGPAAPHPYPNPYYSPPPEPHRRRTCLCCLFSTFLKFLFGFVAFFVVLIIVLVILLRPTQLKVHVDSASLNTFNLTSSGALRHNLTAEVSLRNPNRRVGVYYDWLEAVSYYDGERLQSTPLPAFYQGHKSTNVLAVKLAGETRVDQSGVDFLERQRKEGAFDLELWLDGWVRYKVGSVTTKTYRYKVKCWLPGLRLQGVGFQTTRCDVVKY